MSARTALRLGTRGSTLARIQSDAVARALRGQGVAVELVEIVTAGDRRPVDTPWGDGWFVTAIREALLAGSIDLAVHSAKDVPIEPVAGLAIAALPERADPRDALVLPVVRSDRSAGAADRPGTIDDDPLVVLQHGATVGTDSPRRAGFLRVARPDLRIVPLHGNVDTRLARLDRGDADALVLAVAGLSRLNRADRISAILPPALVAPAPGQGALAIETRVDSAVAAIVARLDDPATSIAVRAERRVLETTGGGCRAPVGALATITGDRIELLAAALDGDGRSIRRSVTSASRADWADLAERAGRDLGPVGVPA